LNGRPACQAATTAAFTPCSISAPPQFFITADSAAMLKAAGSDVQNALALGIGRGRSGKNSRSQRLLRMTSTGSFSMRLAVGTTNTPGGFPCIQVRKLEKMLGLLPPPRSSE
jgi:hypothetical protein